MNFGVEILPLLSLSCPYRGLFVDFMVGKHPARVILDLP